VTLAVLIALVSAAFALHFHPASSTCYAQAGLTASGMRTFVGEVAMNAVPLGTHILLDRPELGRRRYVVEDRIGSGSDLDIFSPSESTCVRYGRREVRYAVVVR
jgi:3D (Asp-Asp-Asp) domain-containing protein